MSKKKSDDKSKNGQAISAEPAPPPLSEKLIAQLQHAVGAARRKRIPASSDASEHRAADNDF